MDQITPTQALAVKFLLPSNVSGRTKWKWKGSGQLAIQGADVLLSGQRMRSFLPSSRQQVLFPISHIRDVVQTDDKLSCSVQMYNGKIDPLALQFESNEIAKSVAQQLPKEHSQEFIDSQSFASDLAAANNRPIVTYGLVAACVLVFVMMVIRGVSPMEPTGEEMIRWGSDYGPLTLRGESWRLFTSMFLHFGIVHLALNMWALLNMGPLTEKLLGNARYAVLYVCAGLAGSMASLLWNPIVNSAGASGAIFGVMGGLLAIMLNPRSRIPFSIARGHQKSAAIFIAYNVFYGFTHGGIDNAAHIGGLLSGFALGWFFAIPLKKVEDDGPAPHNASTAVITSVVVLALLAWPLFHPTAQRAMQREFRFGFADFARVEDEAVTLERMLRTDLEAHRITDVQWGIRTRDGALPLWMKVKDQVETLPDPAEVNLKKLRKALAEYAQLRYLSAELHSEAAIKPDAAKQEWAEATDARLNAKLDETGALIKAAF